MEETSVRAAGPSEDGTERDRTLEVNVIFTDRRSTLAALREAARLAASLRARICILLPSVVPYPLPLEEAPVSEEHQRKLLRELMGKVEVAASAQIVYCRDYGDVARVLPPESLVVLGADAGEWRLRLTTREIRRAVARAGHHLILVNGRKQSAGRCLHSERGDLLRFDVGPGKGLRKALIMELLVAGSAACLLFAYLLYALLQPERF
jgi:K+-transporting ATPase KdpF subunit